MGWHQFLIQHYVRPYLPAKFPGQKIRGFIREEKYPTQHNLAGKSRYFSSEDLVYKRNLPELAVKIAEEVGDKVEHRLSLIYSEIIIDEAQDITRKDLDIVKRLLRLSESQVRLYGDCRQSIIQSNRSSTKNKSADKALLLDWYEDLKKENIPIEIEQFDTTYRCNAAIAEFSDWIFENIAEVGAIDFVKTQSDNHKVTGHDGVFLVDYANVDKYIEKFNPKMLRHRSDRDYKKRDKSDSSDVAFMNIGEAKGLTFDRVGILVPNTVTDLLNKRKPLVLETACKLYVGVTRARYSVAIFVKSIESQYPLIMPDEITPYEIWP